MLKGILSISGHSGLFKQVSEAKNCIIVESLVTGKRMPAYSTSKISSLADIAVFTQTGEITLKEVLKKISEREERKEVTSKDSSNDLKAYFEEILPEYDHDRVYVSDMKKILQWYNVLLKNDLLNFEEEKEGTKPEAEADAEPEVKPEA